MINILLLIIIFILLGCFVLYYFSKNSTYKCNTNIPPSDPIIVKKNQGKEINYKKENIRVKIKNNQIDLFTLTTIPYNKSQQHVDFKYDQFFYIMKGKYNLLTINKFGKIIQNIINEGDFFYINKGTPYSINDISGGQGEVFGGYLPGRRINLVTELPIGEKYIENKYCFYFTNK